MPISHVLVSLASPPPHAPLRLLWFCNLLSRSFRPIPLLIGKAVDLHIQAAADGGEEHLLKSESQPLPFFNERGTTVHTRADVSKPGLA